MRNGVMPLHLQNREPVSHRIDVIGIGVRRKSSRELGANRSVEGRAGHTFDCQATTSTTRDRPGRRTTIFRKSSNKQLKIWTKRGASEGVLHFVLADRANFSSTLAEIVERTHERGQ